MSNNEKLELRCYFNINGMTFMLATDKLKFVAEVTNFPISDFWKQDKGYETMILRFNPLMRTHSIGYYIERYDNKESAQKRHNEIEKLIVEKKYVLLHTNDMKGLEGEFIFGDDK